jgi:hypothetical protein
MGARIGRRSLGRIGDPDLLVFRIADLDVLIGV